MTVKTTTDKKIIIISTRTTNNQTEVKTTNSTSYPTSSTTYTTKKTTTKNRQTIASRTTIPNTIDKEKVIKSTTKKETIDSGKTDYTHGTLITITVISIVCVFILALIMLKRKFGRNNGFVNQAFEMASF